MMMIYFYTVEDKHAKNAQLISSTNSLSRITHNYDMFT